MVSTIKCPCCGEQCMPKYGNILWGLSRGGYHEEKGCWWEDGCVWQGKSKPAPITLWERIKKHGLKARIF